MSDFDYDALTDLMNDENVAAIYVNSFENVYIIHNSKYIQPTGVKFESAEHLAKFAQAMAESGGQTLNSQNPIIEMRLQDRSRATIFGAPVATKGAVIQIQKSIDERFTMDKMVEIGAASRQAADFLTACVKSYMNIVVVGGFNSGRKEFLTVLIEEISEFARLVVIQPISMLNIHHDNAVILETRKADVNGAGAITNRHLLEPALDLHPHRLIVAELDGTEADVLLSAMDVGFGAMFAMTGSGARDALSRLESNVISSNISKPLLAVREQLARTIDVIVHVELFELGEIALKRMVGVHEVRGMKGDTIDLAKLFERPRDRDELLALGEVSQLLDKFRERNVDASEDWFKVE